MERNEKILHRIKPGMRILEIGPSFSPIVPKSSWHNTYIMDHATQDELIAKYAHLNVNIAAIETVDFVWRLGPIHDCVPVEMHGTFDAVIACHVFEHIPDAISFLQSIGRLLKEGGYFSLINPDKRFEFDFLKPLTTTADMVEAFELKRSRHSRRTSFMDTFDNVMNDKQWVWGTWIPVGEIAYLQPHAIYDSTIVDSTEYKDYHAWYFTPSSFDLLILELCALGLIVFSIDTRFGSWGCEFYRTLIKAKPTYSSEALPKERIRLHSEIFRELKEQFDMWQPPHF